MSLQSWLYQSGISVIIHECTNEYACVMKEMPDEENICRT